MTDPEISNALYEGRQGFWMLWKAMEGMKGCTL